MLKSSGKMTIGFKHLHKNSWNENTGNIYANLKTYTHTYDILNKI